jgi:hypothetical protein
MRLIPLLFPPFAAFIELVQSGNGTTQRNTEYGSNKDNKPKRMKSSIRGEKKNMSIVPSHLSQTDVSSVTGGSLMFSNMMFCILKNLASYQSTVLLQNFCSIYIVLEICFYTYFQIIYMLPTLTISIRLGCYHGS